MTVYNALLLTFVMMTLAAIPSSSVMLVIARSTSLNLANGIAAVLGIVAGDMIFVLMAILGLATVNELAGMLFEMVRYIGAAYLFWFGVYLILSANSRKLAHPRITKGSLISSFLSALTLTLGDIKALLFYTSLLPAFIDMQSINQFDIVVIISITVISVGSVKLVYAFGANQFTGYSKSKQLDKLLKVGSGFILLAASGFLLIKT